jgi:hypothetical protein
MSGVGIRVCGNTSQPEMRMTFAILLRAVTSLSVKKVTAVPLMRIEIYMKGNEREG